MQQQSAANYLQQQQQPRPDISDFPTLGSPPGLNSQQTPPSAGNNPLYRAIASTTRLSDHRQRPNMSDFPALSGDGPQTAVARSTTVPPGNTHNNDPLVSRPTSPRATTPGSVYPNRLVDSSASAPTKPEDRYGMLGLLTSNDFGFDVSKFGLPLPSSGLLYPTFGSPWADQSQAYGLIEPDYKLPACYNASRPPSAMTRIGTFSEETLFYIFYTMPRSELQLAAADELYRRQWRYHKELRLWLTKDPESQQPPTARTPRGEQGVFIFFDPGQWQKIKKEFLVVYELLEESRTTTTMAQLENLMRVRNPTSAQQQQIMMLRQQLPGSSMATSSVPAAVPNLAEDVAAASIA